MRLFLLIFALLLSLPARAEESLDYTDTLYFTWARIPLGELTLTMQQQPDGNYGMSAAAKTAGLARLFNQHESLTVVTGHETDSGYIPDRYRSDYVDNGEKRLIAILYDEAANPVKETIIPDREESRPRVPAEMKAGSVDILTGFFVMRQRLRWALTHGTQEFAVKIYDGKRLFRVDATFDGPPVMVAFHGIRRPAIKLLLRRIPLAGYKDKELRKLEKRNPAISLYVEPERLVPFGLSLKVYGARLEAWVKPPPEEALPGDGQ